MYSPYIAFNIAFMREDCPFLRYFFTLPLCGDGNARSLQDNSKIRGYLLLLMSGGRGWLPV
ncbi:hypothetical protein DJ535_01140 [Citrobacter murliniae]|uniref:Uncharacterized protein n=1 Tax=Citrobacter murliniae TaxID=67829 RepID=A0ABY2Q246_9ENTR|nr:hypothetical protein DJ535_01140 [Citrobacter murliniae]